MPETNFKTHIKNFLFKVGILHLIRSSGLWRFKNRSRYKHFFENGLNAFWQVIDLSDKYNLRLWPEFGTLLGIIRENGPIKHDLDLDFGVLYQKELPDLIQKTFSEAGFDLVTACWLKKDQKIISEKYMVSDVEVDIYYFYESGEQFYVYDLETDSGLSIEEELEETSVIRPYKNIFTPFALVERQFRMRQILFPDNHKLHLTELYGSKFMIPDKSWHSNKRKARFLIESEEVELKVFRE